MLGSGNLGMGVTFMLNNQASAPAAEAGRSIMGLSNLVDRAQKSITEASAKLTSGLVATIATVMLMLGPFVSATEASAELNFQISRAGAVSRSTAEEMRMMKDAALEYGNQTIYNAVEVAKAEFLLSQAGFKAQQQLEMLPDLINLATAGVVGLDYAATVATDTMYQFGLATRDMGKIADIIVNAANQSMVSVENFSTAMRYLGPTAKAFGISLEEAAGYIEMMANSGMRGSIGTRAFGTSLVNLASPTKQAAEIMQQLGFDAYNSAGNFVGLTEMTRRLQASLTGLTNKERDKAISIIFGNEAIQEMLQLLNLEYTAVENGTEIVYKGADALEYFTQKNREAKGVAAEVAKGVMNNLKTDLKLLSAAFETLKITIGDALESSLRPMVMGLRSFTQSVSEFSSTKFGAILINVAAGLAAVMSSMIVLGFVFTVLIPTVWGMVTAMGALLIELAPVILAIALVAAEVYVLKKAYDDFQDSMNGDVAPATGFMGVMQKIGAIISSILEIWTSWNGQTFSLSEKLHDALERIGLLDFVLNLATWIIRLKEFFTGIVEGVVFMYVILEQVFGFMFSSIESLLDAFDEIGVPLRKLGGSLELFKLIGYGVAATVTLMALPFIILGSAISMVANAIEFLIVNWKEMKKIGIAGFLDMTSFSQFSHLRTAISNSNFVNPFDNDKGRLLPGASTNTGNFDFAEIANRHSQIMAQIGLGRKGEGSPSAGIVGPMPSDSITVPIYLDSDKIAEKVIEKQNLKQARQ